MNMYIRFSVILGLLLFLSGNLSAQTLLNRSERTQRALEAIQTLNQGVLVVRIPSQRKKIERMEEEIFLAKDKDNEKKLRKRLQKTIEQRDAYTKAMMKAFEQHYEFGPVLMMYDSAWNTLKSNPDAAVFLSKELTIDPALSLGDRDFLLVRMGNLDPAFTSGAEAMIVADSSGTDLYRPFPYYQQANTLGTFFKTLFNAPDAESSNLNRMVKKMNKDLKKFWEKASGKA